jgi:surfeit locus 1 family protein
MSSATTRRRIVLAAAMLGMLLTASLGVWQLNRASQKETIAALIKARGQAMPLSNQHLHDSTQSAAPLDGLYYAHAMLQGQWLPEHTIYLDNRQMQGHQGFYVLTPFKLTDTQDILLVQRGWVARNFADRRALPKLNTANDQQSIDVMLTPAPGKLWQFAEDNSSLIRQNVDLKNFAQEKHLALLPLSAQQLANERNASDGLLRDWPVINTGVEKHYGYAAQWFGLSLLIAVLTIWFQLIKPRRMAKQDHEHE